MSMVGYFWILFLFLTACSVAGDFVSDDISINESKQNNITIIEQRNTTIPFVYDLKEPAKDVAVDEAKIINKYWLGCEIYSFVYKPYNEPKDARGAAGELGIAQIHPTWRTKMEEMGLDISKEIDRLDFALSLAKDDGLSENWIYCAKNAPLAKIWEP